MKIAFVSQPEYFRFCYEDDLSKDHCVREFPFHFGMDKSELDDLIQFEPDVTFFFRGEFVPSGFIERLGGLKVAISSEPFPRYIGSKIEYTLDSIKRYLDFRSRIRGLPFDYVFHYDESSIEYMAKDGLIISGAFPFPVATDTYLPAPAVQKEWDLFFIGRSTQHREEFFGPLKHNLNFLHICHGIFGPPLVQYIQKAKVNLNVHAEDEISWEPRMQMLLSAGAFVISEPITPNSVLRPGIDYIEASTPAEMYQLTQYYLAHTTEREAIAQSGRARVLQCLSANVNFVDLVDKINQGVYPKYRAESPRFLVDCMNVAAKIFAKASGVMRR